MEPRVRAFPAREGGGCLTNFYAYDEAGRKTFERNANWELIRYTNSPAGDLLALVDGKNHVTKWNYDEQGRVTNKLDQAAVEILRYKYYPDSRLTNRWSKAKGDTKYQYDPAGNLTNIDYPVSTDVRFEYDALNRVTKMVDAAGSWTNGFGYDAAKRLTSVTSPAGAFTYTLGAAASASPLVKKLLLPNTSYITNTYDGVARLLGTYLPGPFGSKIYPCVPNVPSTPPGCPCGCGGSSNCSCSPTDDSGSGGGGSGPGGGGGGGGGGQPSGASVRGPAPSNYTRIKPHRFTNERRES